jgi:coenzyme PQQ biosynthesis protein PqqD
MSFVEVITDDTYPALARGTRLSTDKQTGEPLLLFPEGVVHLSATANAILQQCDGQAAVGGIIAALACDFDADPGVIRGDVLECLSQLHRRKLVILT